MESQTWPKAHDLASTLNLVNRFDGIRVASWNQPSHLGFNATTLSNGLRLSVKTTVIPSGPKILTASVFTNYLWEVALPLEVALLKQAKITVAP
eukprot:758254-Amphidinium_carterae.1